MISELLMKKVLIVDDEAEIVELISMVPEDDELSVLAAYDGEQALELVRTHHPDLVLSDVMMPRLDGRELCRRIRSDPETSDTIVLLMSAIHRLDPEEVKADGLIRKPFDILDISDRINGYLAKSA